MVKCDSHLWGDTPMREAAKIQGPVYLRFTKGPIKPVYDENVELTIGKANMLKDGKDIAIIANGDTVNIVVSAAEILESKGVSVRLLDMHTIKPLDMDAVTDCLVNIGKVITVEDASWFTLLKTARQLTGFTLTAAALFLNRIV